MSNRFQRGAYHIVLEDALEGATPHDCDTGMTCCDGCAHTGHMFQDLPEGHPDLAQRTPNLSLSDQAVRAAVIAYTEAMNYAIIPGSFEPNDAALTAMHLALEAALAQQEQPEMPTREMIASAIHDVGPAEDYEQIDGPKAETEPKDAPCPYCGSLVEQSLLDDGFREMNMERNGFIVAPKPKWDQRDIDMFNGHDDNVTG